MSTVLPNGLECPDQSTAPDIACQLIKDLYIAVDALQTNVGGASGTTPPSNNVKVNMPSANWILTGDSKCSVYRQTVAVPSGFNPYTSVMSIFDAATGASVPLCMVITSLTTVEFETNTPTNYCVVYA